LTIPLQNFIEHYLSHIWTGIQFGDFEVTKLYLFGEVRFLHFLLLLMGLDIITGLFKAWKNKELWSRDSLFGYARKLLILVVVILANVIDQILSLGGAVAYATVLFYIASEGLSIVENLAQVGVPFPTVIVKKLKNINFSRKDVTEENKEEIISIDNEKRGKIDLVKVAIDAGHGGFGVTPGKRSPANEYEWDFNNKVVVSAIKYLKAYGIDVLRLDDPTGKTDVSLTTRTNKANAWGADILISCHHNANTGKWGEWTGTETYTYVGKWTDAERLAGLVQKRLVNAYGLHDRGLKKADFHMLRESIMTAILIECGYMDSTIDIKKMRDDRVLEAAGKAVADAVAEYFGIEDKSSKPIEKPGEEIDMKEFEELKKELAVLKKEVAKKQDKPNDSHTPDPAHAKAWKEATEAGYVDGKHPHHPLTREQYATIRLREKN